PQHGICGGFGAEVGNIGFIADQLILANGGGLPGPQGRIPDIGLASLLADQAVHGIGENQKPNQPPYQGSPGAGFVPQARENKGQRQQQEYRQLQAVSGEVEAGDQGEQAEVGEHHQAVEQHNPGAGAGGAAPPPRGNQGQGVGQADGTEQVDDHNGEQRRQVGVAGIAGGEF